MLCWAQAVFVGLDPVTSVALAKLLLSEPGDFGIRAGIGFNLDESLQSRCNKGPE